VNWADFPSVSQFANQRPVLHNLEKNGAGTYAYDVRFYMPDSSGKWNHLPPPYSGKVEAEHGFVSMVPLQDKMGVFWLDGRNYADDNAYNQMMLAYAEMDANGQVDSHRIIDYRVCDCCQTDAVMTDLGPLVVYRSRSEKEIRDIFFNVNFRGSWSGPEAVHHDGWQISGCPVNGPAVDYRNGKVAVAWFTAAQDSNQVKVSFGKRQGFTYAFDQAFPLHVGKTIGRVDVILDTEGTAWASWMEYTDTGAIILVRSVDDTGTMGKPIEVAEVRNDRSTGFPRMISVEGKLIIAWTERDPKIRLRLASLNILAR
ncbi:MAG: hypothetical protein AAF206_25545, partial [Bacteroidota bacterium]